MSTYLCSSVSASNPSIFGVICDFVNDVVIRVLSYNKIDIIKYRTRQASAPVVVSAPFQPPPPVACSSAALCSSGYLTVASVTHSKQMHILNIRCLCFVLELEFLINCIEATIYWSLSKGVGMFGRAFCVSLLAYSFGVGWTKSVCSCRESWTLGTR